MYCTQCCQVAHKSKTCKEAEQDRTSDIFRRAEEAMTKATVRRCPNPKCQKEFQKLDGCNKMTCTCKTLSCYLCEMDITTIGYTHFCAKMDCQCEKCHLWGKFEETDKVNRRMAGRKVLEDAGIDSEEIDRFLTSPQEKKRSTKTQPRDQQRRLEALRPEHQQAQAQDRNARGPPEAQVLEEPQEPARNFWGFLRWLRWWRR